jgi:hypothetical protein
MELFDYSAPADVFALAPGFGRHRHMTYRRFPTGGEAILHVIEALDAVALAGVTLETDGGRLDASEIKALYYSDGFPLKRVQ